MTPSAFVLSPAVSMDATTAADADGSLDEVFDRCAPGLYRYFAVRAGGDRHRADDLMQQLWLAARTAETRPPPDEIEFWLRAIARNLVHAWWRRVNREALRLPRANAALAADLAEKLISGDLPDTALERRETQEQLLLALSDLPCEHQELLVQHYFHDLSHAELAARRRLSPRAIEGRLYRARAALREKLHRLED